MMWGGGGYSVLKEIWKFDECGWSYFHDHDLLLSANYRVSFSLFRY
jgi:hypothetical protein